MEENIPPTPKPQTTNSLLPQRKPKSHTREWVDAVLFAVIAVTIVRWGLIEACTIPTPSMEGTLIVGDFLFVSKVHYGARTPQTPLQLPLTHQTIWNTQIPSFLDWLQLPVWRLPSLSNVQRNDVVVFNYPGKEEEHLPIDQRTNFIKRCVGLPNDKIEINEMRLYVNDELAINPSKMQTSYYILADEVINEQAFKLLSINDVRSAPNGYVVNTDSETARRIQQIPAVREVLAMKDVRGRGSDKVFPYSKEFEWNMDNFGVITIPAKNMTIVLDNKNLALYEYIILRHENNHKPEVKNGKLFFDGKEQKTYTFKQDYYFMLGDNRHNSDDSRVWGFVPESHIIGKGLVVWWSLNPEGEFGDLLGRIRWERIGNSIK